MGSCEAWDGARVLVGNSSRTAGLRVLALDFCKLAAAFPSLGLGVTKSIVSGNILEDWANIFRVWDRLTFLGLGVDALSVGVGVGLSVGVGVSVRVGFSGGAVGLAVGLLVGIGFSGGVALSVGLLGGSWGAWLKEQAAFPGT